MSLICSYVGCGLRLAIYILRLAILGPRPKNLLFRPNPKRVARKTAKNWAQDPKNLFPDPISVVVCNTKRGAAKCDTSSNHSSSLTTITVSAYAYSATSPVAVMQTQMYPGLLPTYNSFPS